ncbi:MAG: hypothetical protein IPO15_18440 [Anaerolineae bacterium]|uniref:hypothetical protein n=1 Tax=Candidatus Amarolinea dominans TaxID=3140696 RepID=UPI0031357B0A|nr:hypothetical protein [Anaerolineae bacterium]
MKSPTNTARLRAGATALTYFLMQSMQSAAADATFRDVFESVTAEVSSRYRQNPQIEGALDRPLFA